MSLSEKEELVIDIIRDQDMYGLDIVSKSGGALKRGTVYVTLSRMEEKGLIEGRTELSDFGRMARKIYRVTEVGLETFYRRHFNLPRAVVVSG